MFRIKVLECPKYASWIGEQPFQTEYFTKKEIIPVYNRKGWYYDRYVNTSWIEYNGKAYSESVTMFTYTLSLLNHKPLNNNEIISIKTLLHNKYIPNRKELLEILTLDNEWKELINIKRGTRMYCISLFKEDDNN